MFAGYTLLHCYVRLNKTNCFYITTKQILPFGFASRCTAVQRQTAVTYKVNNYCCLTLYCSVAAMSVVFALTCICQCLTIKSSTSMVRTRQKPVSAYFTIWQIPIVGLAEQHICIATGFKTRFLNEKETLTRRRPRQIIQSWWYFHLHNALAGQDHIPYYYNGLETH